MNIRFIMLFLSLLMLSLPTQAVTVSAPPGEKQILIKNKIDLNKADLVALTGSFKGIGKKKAEAIIAYRESHHGFKSLEELADIKGFGQRFMEKNREQLKTVFTINP